jgi:UDP-sulfoquinovose synthase
MGLGTPGGQFVKVLIAGIDGFLGWALAQHLATHDHEVSGIDNYARRAWVAEMGSDSAIPIAAPDRRLAAFRDRFGGLRHWEGDLRDAAGVARFVREQRPDAVVQLGECPSAPYSMIDVEHASYVQTNNIAGTFSLLFALRDWAPDAHLVKLGTMGEYGTPDVDIPEGFFDVEFRGRQARLPFPRQAGSWYHWSKVHGSNNVMFACRLWGLRATDVMQGVVYGTRFYGHEGDPRLATRLDFDQAFGTAVNRFCCQAVLGQPLSVYGSGGQRRGFLPLDDVMTCLRLLLEHPPAAGEYRVVNQFDRVYSVADLASAVAQAADRVGIEIPVRHLPNPRVEHEEHHYRPDRRLLETLGYAPSSSLSEDLDGMMRDLLPHRDRISAHADALAPSIGWRTPSTETERIAHVRTTR